MRQSRVNHTGSQHKDMHVSNQQKLTLIQKDVTHLAILKILDTGHQPSFCTIQEISLYQSSHASSAAPSVLMLEGLIMNLYLSSIFNDVGPINERLDNATLASFCAAAASLSFLLATQKSNSNIIKRQTEIPFSKEIQKLNLNNFSNCQQKQLKMYKNNVQKKRENHTFPVANATVFPDSTSVIAFRI